MCFLISNCHRVSTSCVLFYIIQCCYFYTLIYYPLAFILVKQLTVCENDIERLFKSLNLLRHHEKTIFCFVTHVLLQNGSFLVSLIPLKMLHACLTISRVFSGLPSLSFPCCARVGCSWLNKLIWANQ